MQEETENMILQIKAGNQAAFKSLVEKHQKYAYRLAFRILQDEEEARDTVQESFIKIWQNINAYDQKHNFKTWMYKIVTNSAIDNHRKLSRMKIINFDNEIPVFDKVKFVDANTNFDNNELARLIKYLSKGLPEKQKIIFILKDIHGFESNEIEYILDINANALKSNLYLARKLIAKKLKTLTS